MDKLNYGSQILGTGSGFPETVVSNLDLEKFIETNDEWIRTRTGIETRRLSDPKKGETTLSLALKASIEALKNADLSPQDLDMIVVGTVTPDMIMPCTANMLQAHLGAKRAFGFDLQAACSGWLYGLSVADHFIRGGTVRNVLVVGAETLSTIVNWADRSTCVLFGDGAGATVLTRTEDPDHRVLATRLYSDGSMHELLQIPHGYGKVPPYSAEYRLDQHKIQMKGNEVFKVAVRSMVEASTTILWENKLALEDVDHFIFHQANIRIIDLCAKTLGLDPKKVWINVNKYGNISAATLPVSIDEARRSGVAKKGDLILLATFGGGLTWASGLVRL